MVSTATANQGTPAQDVDDLDRVMGIDYVPPAPVAYGHCMVSTRKVVLQQGAPMGRADFDNQVHKPEQMRTEITISIAPLAGTRTQFETTRSFLAESEDWGKVVKPSLVKMGLGLKGVNNRFVRAELVPTRQYQKRDPQSRQPMLAPDGKPVMATATALAFTNVYDDEGACLVAHRAQFGGDGTDVPPAGTQPGMPGIAESEPVNETERATALQILKAMAQGANGNAALLHGQVKSTPLLAKYYYDAGTDAFAPEVAALLANPASA